ncbi:MAG: prepilin-type N-terminal cleavage/methylation domain-containing protein [Phycisphaerae bacterium]|nr:prepilin-type N-terminal cleavage/methylation domain-containing protein [Phycisphaerae bacterium]NIP52074.1 prepilin-type N-terminal cleavage/methylation domain-containing protein [Phycisphaerae bacterium]NIS50039.1 prepilin-type N-terminal cleavage/methylation domain-containing protein [Phycisphaerae bacterium]NIU10294.1 prepilin-type N-terminal cleavage/methylation domain-containing protein [Phycisphaerae bacterium]NIU55305.1 prepilin-type N-terminal cleavage/methylation domain-containing 
MISYNKYRNGFTLAEAMVATVVLGIAAAGVLLPFMSGAAVRVEGTRGTLAAKLAGDLMEEIVNTPFEQIIAEYDGYSEPQGQVKDASGTVFTDLNYANFSRDVSCVYVVMPQESGDGELKFIRIIVRVYYRGGEIATVSRLVSG